MAATFQNMSQGGLLLNVVTGGESHEQRAYGDFLDKEARYARCDEFLEVVRRLWAGETVDFAGEHIRVEGARLQQLPELPEGSTVEFEIGLQGSVIVSQMLAGKQQIGYAGDMPAIVGASKRDTRDLRIVATLGTAQDQCGVFLTRPDAPDFKSQKEAIGWFDGKTISTAQGSCTDRIAQATFDQVGVKPKEYLNQSIEVITSSFESGKIDGAIIWEPTASKFVNEGLAKRVGSGSEADQQDAGYMLMDHELIEERPDVAEEWLAAELEAQRFLADPKNADEIVQIALDQTEGFTEQDLRDALYRAWPADKGGSEEGVRLDLPFVVDEAGVEHIEYSAGFLADIDVIPDAELPPGAVWSELAEKVLRESDTPDGAGTVRALRN
jgi:NitT/TauT family transport system substrate-binding protein